MERQCPYCRQPLENLFAGRCTSCGAPLGVLPSPVGGRWHRYVSFLVSTVFHAVLFIVLALWTWGGRGIEGISEDVAIGRLPEEVLSEQQEAMQLEPVEAPVQEASATEVLIEVEPPESASVTTSNESFAAAMAPSPSGATGTLQFDTGLPGSGGSGGSWEGLIQTLRRNGLDIVIVFDSTGSMTGEIDQVKRQIERIFTALLRLVPQTRVSLCTYRDVGDEYVVKGIGLTRDVQELVRFLQNVYADAGGDLPEAVDEGLKWAVEQNQFRSSARKVVLIFGDAPPHEEKIQYCLSLASDFHRKHQGIVSTVTCRSPVPLPQFVQIARSGGGEAFVTSDERQIMTQLMVLVFGSRYRDKVVEALRLSEP